MSENEESGLETFNNEEIKKIFTFMEKYISKWGDFEQEPFSKLNAMEMYGILSRNMLIAEMCLNVKTLREHLK